MSTNTKVANSDKIWACLLTNASYLPGLLTLAFSLRRVESQYPLVALHTGSLPEETLDALKARDIPIQQVPYLFPGPPPPPKSSGSNDTTNGTTHHANHHEDSVTAAAWYANDPRFRACFTKLSVFSLEAYDRVVLLDADMLVLRNMDELFEIPLDEESRVFAAGYACTCNPMRFKHYPVDWVRENCAFTKQERELQRTGMEGEEGEGGGNGKASGVSMGEGLLNGGLVVLRPSKPVYEAIMEYLRSDKATHENLPFADQSLLAELFRGRWVALSWVYNGLKTMRWKHVHATLWSDNEVKNVHYILTPKPWELDKKDAEKLEDGPDRWWWDVDSERRRWEAERGIV